MSSELVFVNWDWIQCMLYAVTLAFLSDVSIWQFYTCVQITSFSVSVVNGSDSHKHEHTHISTRHSFTHSLPHEWRKRVFVRTCLHVSSFSVASVQIWLNWKTTKLRLICAAFKRTELPMCLEYIYVSVRECLCVCWSVAIANYNVDLNSKNRVHVFGSLKR